MCTVEYRHAQDISDMHKRTLSGSSGVRGRVAVISAKARCTKMTHDSTGGKCGRVTIRFQRKARCTKMTHDTTASEGAGVDLVGCFLGCFLACRILERINRYMLYLYKYSRYRYIPFLKGSTGVLYLGRGVLDWAWVLSWELSCLPHTWRAIACKLHVNCM